MSWEEQTFYALHCDWPGCEVSSKDFSDEYSHWMEKDYVEDQANDAGWWQGRGEGEWYCDGHPVQWDSDEHPLTGTPAWFAGRYLLVHEADGKVTLQEMGS